MRWSALMSLLAAAVLFGGCDAELSALAEPPAWLQSPPAEPLLEWRVDRDRVALFDPVRVVVDRYAPDGWDVPEPELDAPADWAADGELLRVETALPGGVWTRWMVTWRPARTGELELPVLELTAARGAEASRALVAAALRVTVASVLDELPEGVAADTVEAPADAFAPRAAWWPWIFAGVGALAVLFMWRRWRRRSAAAAPDQVELPAHVEALRALARQRSAPRVTPAEIDAFYVGVTAALRRYLERRFGLHAPERTTEEFLPELERSGVLDRDSERRLGRFLGRCDLVKFAGEHPPVAAHDEALQFAEELVQATRADRVDAAVVEVAS